MKQNSVACSNGGHPDDTGEPPTPGPVARLLLAALAFYKRAVSPFFAGSCRFLPSCADYAREAVIRHGAVRGSWLALTRLARCHPLCAAGYDPVPAAGSTPRAGAPDTPPYAATRGVSR